MIILQTYFIIRCRFCRRHQIGNINCFTCPYNLLGFLKGDTVQWINNVYLNSIGFRIEVQIFILNTSTHIKSFFHILIDC